MVWTSTNGEFARLAKNRRLSLEFADRESFLTFMLWFVKSLTGTVDGSDRPSGIAGYFVTDPAKKPINDIKSLSFSPKFYQTRRFLETGSIKTSRSPKHERRKFKLE